MTRYAVIKQNSKWFDRFDRFGKLPAGKLTTLRVPLIPSQVEESNVEGQYPIFKNTTTKHEGPEGTFQKK